MQRYVTRSYWSDGNISVSRPMSPRNAERNADRMREHGLVREVEIVEALPCRPRDRAMLAARALSAICRNYRRQGLRDAVHDAQEAAHNPTDVCLTR
jgi:hypothetical protein